MRSPLLLRGVRGLRRSGPTPPSRRFRCGRLYAAAMAPNVYGVQAGLGATAAKRNARRATTSAYRLTGQVARWVARATTTRSTIRCIDGSVMAELPLLAGSPGCRCDRSSKADFGLRPPCRIVRIAEPEHDHGLRFRLAGRRGLRPSATTDATNFAALIHHASNARHQAAERRVDLRAGFAFASPLP